MAPIDPRARRLAAVRAKLGSLRGELVAWQGVPKLPGFAIHASQIAEVCGGMQAMHEMLVAELEGAVLAAGLVNGGVAVLSLDGVARFERKILAAFQIWEAYRGKFALRFEESLRLPLALADELAWEAYAPARERARPRGATSDAPKPAPPLVFPNVRWSPFARSREQAYEFDEQSGDFAALADFDRWVRAIPVPLVGIPWYQIAHLPDAVFIGHEVGHIVEEDFGLEESLRAALSAGLAGENEDQRTAWTRYWRSEVFADVYGVLTAGPAYAMALLDLLAGDAATVKSEHQPDQNRPASQRWSAYPTRALRALIACEAVRQLPTAQPDSKVFTTKADDLQRAWQDAHPKHAMPDYASHIPRVVTALLTTKLPEFATSGSPAGACITSVLTFTAAMEADARRDAANANGRRAVSSSDIRTLFAAVTQAFLDDHEAFVGNGANKRFGERLAERRAEGKRALVGGAVTPARHHSVGTALMAHLATLDRGRR